MTLPLGSSSGKAPTSARDFFGDDSQWVDVFSSNLHSVAFLKQGLTGTLGIRFLDPTKMFAASEYWYLGVSVATWEGLMNASSHGQYFHANIKGKYSWRNIWKK